MDFTSLLKLAGKQTAASQTELAAKEAARQAALKADQIAASKRAQEEKRQAEERRVIREARERKAREEEERRVRELPKTRNLWVLKQERIKRGLDPDGSEDWKIAAEPDTKKRSSSSATAVGSKSGGGGVKKERSATNSPRPTASTAMAPGEKAAARKRKMFKEEWDDEPSGSMALLRAFGGPNRSASPAGSASRHDSPQPKREGGKSTSTNSAQRRDSKPAPLKNTSNAASRPGQGGSSASGSAGLSAKDRLKAAAGKPGANLIALNSNKRDTRTIDEIERDMRLKREAKNGTAPPPRPSTAGWLTRPAANSGSTVKRPASESSYHQSSSKKPRPDERNRPPSSSRKRQESESEDSGSYESDSEEEHYDPRQRSKQSDMIWKLMGRDRQRDMARDIDSDDDDMEVSGEQLRREEQRAARLGAREDEEERTRLERAAEEKRRRLKGGK